ncbi:flagellum-specific peptidoglycan hydrolase FlgJ [Kineothrix alysoides]|uniref:Flagellum-specific peptidoglycan hydrolase FlgJ n=1 Tax=Kineothrix alysoides TaxID=1469948 RepID=A0A4R1R510_9FIRM|nr:glucosaminidase domain-containing protein [Kineothrix alysoides]TCL60584.1 flagellum-specific peptidoglycan hydrolase FlgJ [Kineothrix alysoides]
MTDEQKKFIEQIGNAAVSYYKTYGILPSLTIAQAILESAWGKSGLSRDCYNYFGMKWTKNCGCDYKEYYTKEQNADGSYVTITAKFRRYANTEEGIRGYYLFLSGYKRYSNLKGVTDSSLACDLIRQDGWATSLSYATNLKNLIKNYNLTQYDVKVIGQVVAVSNEVFAYTTGNYRVTASALRVRTGPGTSFEQKKFEEMTVVARNVNRKKKTTGLAFYVKDIIFTAQTIEKISQKEYWAKTPSGYVCLQNGNGVYVQKR